MNYADIALTDHFERAISLYLGRMPALPDLPLEHTPELRQSCHPLYFSST